MSTVPTSVPAWTPAELLARIEGAEPLTLLDIRNRAEAEGLPIEGRSPVPTLHVPYAQMLQEGGRQDPVASVMAYATAHLAEQIPRDRPVLVVCSRGRTAGITADGLRHLGYPAFHLEGGAQAWGLHYDVRPVATGGGVAIEQVARTARGCLSYILTRDGESVVVDPQRHVDVYEAAVRARGGRIVRVIDTHGHADHVTGGPELARRAGVPYHLHPYDAIHPIDVLPATIAYEPLRDGQTLALGGSRIEVLHVPGHTLGNVALHVDGRWLFTGDSIFIASIARPDLGGHGETWAPLHYHSLRRLLALPDDTWVLPGHFSSPAEAGADGVYAAPLGRLRDSNDGLRMAAGDERAFVAYILASLPQFPPQYVDIKRVNAGLQAADDERAGELELGKNVCALSQPVGS